MNNYEFSVFSKTIENADAIICKKQLPTLTLKIPIVKIFSDSTCRSVQKESPALLINVNLPTHPDVTTQ